MSPTRILLVAAAALGAVILSGCAAPGAGPASPSESTPSTPEASSQPTPAPNAADPGAIALTPRADWIDGGHALVVTTYGSSSCPPVLTEASADGQHITVTLGPSEQKMCTADLAPRATYVPAPDGVDAATKTTVTIDLQGESTEVEVAATTVAASAGQKPYASWITAGPIALVTWGAGNCTPHVSDVTVESPTAATVTFAPIEGPCTRDLAPRVTFIGVDGLAAQATLTLQDLDGAAEASTVTVDGTPHA